MAPPLSRGGKLTKKEVLKQKENNARATETLIL